MDARRLQIYAAITLVSAVSFIIMFNLARKL